MHAPGRASAYRRRDNQLGGALFLAALALLLSFGWGLLDPSQSKALGAGTAGVASEPRQPTSTTYRQPAPGGALVGADGARRSVAAFLGQPEPALEAELERAAAWSGERYLLETPAGDYFRVDGRTGEVLEASLPSRLERPADPSRRSPPDLEQLAEQFVVERFFGLEKLTLVERSTTPTGDGQNLHRFRWALLAAESGAELPTSVTVALTADRGEPVWYLAQRDAAAIDPRPAIGREAAIATGAALVEREGRWDARQPTSTRLRVIYDEFNRQRLVWSITFPSRPDPTPGGRPGLRVLVDAHTGRPLNLP